MSHPVEGQDRPQTPSNAAPTAAPETDPTNPNRQEAVREWTRAEQENGRRLDEPGLVDSDRDDRAQKR